MNVIIDYLKQYPYYTKVLVICFAVLVVIISAIFILRVVVNEKRNAAAQNQNDDFAPEKNQTDDFSLAKNEQESAQEQYQELEKAKEQTLSSSKTQTSSLVASEPQKQLENQENEKSSDELESCWKITEQSGVFFASLVYGEEILLLTSGYSSLSGVKSGIDTLKNNLHSENYAINVNQSGEFYFKVFSTANRLLCTSAGFPTRERCEHSFLKCKKASSRAPIVM